MLLSIEDVFIGVLYKKMFYCISFQSLLCYWKKFNFLIFLNSDSKKLNETIYASTQVPPTAPLYTDISTGGLLLVYRLSFAVVS